jgi:hypothetical protein
MASPPVADRVPARPAAPAKLRAKMLQLSVLPLALTVIAIVIAAALGHVLAGLLFGAGLCLGAANGIAAQVAVAQMAGGDIVDRSAVVRSSLRRLGVITVIAIVIAFAARPTGWLVLLGLAVYQLIATGATIGATMRELRRG